MGKFYNSLTEIKSAVKSGETSVLDLVKKYLYNISINEYLNAFNEVFDNEALSFAETIDAKIKAGTAGRLAGMVIAIKDNICYKGHKVSASSRILNNFVSIYSSTVVERLLAEDVIIIGRCNCDEFGMGAANENSAYGPVKNYADTTRVSGGSSGGSAVAVQANMCHAALGTDTGGSVRQPASFCGLIGLKPTYGRISRHGIIAYASSFDQVGTITRSVEDAALLLEIMAGSDAYDSTLSSVPVPSYSQNLRPVTSPVKIAYMEEALTSPGVDDEVKANFSSAIDKLREAGHTVNPIAFDYLDYMVPAYYILAMAEASSNLSRYDGIHFGFRSADAHDLQSTYKKIPFAGVWQRSKAPYYAGNICIKRRLLRCLLCKSAKGKAADKRKNRPAVAGL